MGGVALGRLWDTHPKLAFVIHLLTSVAIGLLFLVFLLSGSGSGTVLVFGILFFFDLAAFVVFTIDAAQRGWTKNS